jgi:ABC-type uncharacterized transport system involved in gliding motility auxiliary subunit
MERLNALDRRQLAVAGIVLALVLFVALNLFSAITFQQARVDFTEDKLYTLSDGTLQVIRDIEEPITLRFYFSRAISDQVPAFGNYAKRVRELLENYAQLSGGKLRLKIHDPLPYSVEEDEAVTFGLQGVPVDRSGELGYFGLAGSNSTDDKKAIAYFNSGREPFLEYDVTRLIYDLAHPEKKKIGVMTDLQIWGDPSNNVPVWSITDMLSQVFLVRILNTDLTSIDDEIDLLFLIPPKELGDPTLYAIDQFVLRGGRLMVFVDPVSEMTAAPGVGGRPPGMPTTARLGKLLDAWGVDFDPDIIAADQANAVQVRMGRGPGGGENITDYLSWLHLGPVNFARDDVVTSELRRIALASAGILSPKEGATTEFKPLIMTSRRSMRMEAKEVRFMPNPQALLEKFKPENEILILAARIRGKVKSAFPDGPPAKTKKDAAETPAKDGDGEEPARPHLAESVEPINVVVVADSDMLTDQMWVQEQNFFGQRVIVPISNNADFTINVLDNLSGSGALVGLRGRGFSLRPFDRIDALQRTAELRYRSTERMLREKLNETQRKLGELETETSKESAGGAIILTEKQRQTLDDFRLEMVSVRQQLREVQRALRQDIEDLNTRLKVINIWAMPVLISIIALAMGILRRWRFRRQETLA